MGVNGIYGLSGSGLDIESMVKVGMMSKQNEYDKMAQKYTKNEWTKAAYIELNSSINSFNMTKLSSYKMSSSMNAKTATSSKDTIKALAGSGATVMTHKVEVDTLAANAHLVGTKSVTRKNESASATSINLADTILKGISQNAANSDQVDVTYGKGSTFKATFDKSDVAISFTLSDGTQKSDGTDNTKTIKYTYGQLLSGKTFNDFASDITNAGLNIRASYDSVNDRFSFYNTEGGEANNITFTLDALTGEDRYGDYGDVTENADGTRNVTNLSDTDKENLAVLNARDFINNLNLKQSVNGVTGSAFTATVDGSSIAAGVTGSVLIDGAEYKTTDNKVTANGITYDVNAAAAGDVSIVSVSQDVDAIVEKVKSFVEDYNTLLSSLYEKYDEKPDSNYKPLTQSQKDSMKEEQIEKWEEKAKKGVLYHDQTLSKIILNMRSAVSNQIDLGNGQTTSAYSIGISTVAGNIKGQLTLDEDKLRKALANDSDAVYNVFAKLDANDMSNSAKSGIAQRLGDVFTTANKSIKSRAGSSTDVVEDSDLNNLLRQLQTRMSDFKKMMNAFEDKLYKKYDTMESTLARLGTQLNFISGVGQG